MHEAVDKIYEQFTKNVAMFEPSEIILSKFRKTWSDQGELTPWNLKNISHLEFSLAFMLSCGIVLLVKMAAMRVFVWGSHTQWTYDLRAMGSGCLQAVRTKASSAISKSHAVKFL
jgi:hypothetical protein